MDQDMLRFLLEPQHRRSWLLFKALECAPLDRALDLARTADAFTTGEGDKRSLELESEDGSLDPGSDQGAPGVEPDERGLSAELSAEVVEPEATASGSTGVPERNIRREAPENPSQTRLGLSDEQRDRLMHGLASGATNAELAASFGLTPRQVQGVRMGSARKTSRPVEGPGDPASAAETPSSNATPNSATPIDEVIRYLRQQDDVVVPQGAGVFLINGRFRMEVAELFARANKIRARQAKPQFTMVIGERGRGRSTSLVNGHPLFWNGSASKHEPAKSA